MLILPSHAGILCGLSLQKLGVRGYNLCEFIYVPVLPCLYSSMTSGSDTFCSVFSKWLITLTVVRPRVWEERNGIILRPKEYLKWNLKFAFSLSCAFETCESGYSKSSLEVANQFAGDLHTWENSLSWSYAFSFYSILKHFKYHSPFRNDLHQLHREDLKESDNFKCMPICKCA